MANRSRQVRIGLVGLWGGSGARVPRCRCGGTVTRGTRLVDDVERGLQVRRVSGLREHRGVGGSDLGVAAASLPAVMGDLLRPVAHVGAAVMVDDEREHLVGQTTVASIVGPRDVPAVPGSLPRV
jgi:hypothetical protein